MTPKDAGGVVVIYTTLPDPIEANKIADALIGEKLAACVNVVQGMTSIYEWQGKVERSSEVACLIKTTRLKSALAMERIAALHPYDTPAILQIEADAVDTRFAAWVAKQTNS